MGTVEAGEAAVTLEQTSTFLGAARTDLTCDAELLRAGRTVLYGTATVRDTRDALVTHHTLTYCEHQRPTGSRSVYGRVSGQTPTGRACAGRCRSR
jgi:acyl-coenzyme A thioesterase PaaI-like protein